MLFIGRLGELALAGKSPAIGFANIIGYSILLGLAMGMVPICGQDFGAKKHTMLGLSLQRTVLLRLFTSSPISLLWLNMKKILLICGQDEAMAKLPLSCDHILYIPINYFLVSYFDMGIKGVALSEVWSNYNLVASLIITSSSLGSTKKPGEGFQ
ncbi:hypothetical protein ACFX13_042622 [Malus domestica]